MSDNKAGRDFPFRSSSGSALGSLQAGMALSPQLSHASTTWLRDIVSMANTTFDYMLFEIPQPAAELQQT